MDANYDYIYDYGTSIGRSATDAGYSVIVTSDGGYALAGGTKQLKMPITEGAPHTLDFDFWLVKTDGFGNVEWNQTYEAGRDDEIAYSLVEALDGGYALAGFTTSLGADGWDVWLVKTDDYGTMEWNKTYGGVGDEVAFSLVATSDGGYALAGVWNCSTDFESYLVGDFWLVKIDALGNVEWNQTYGGESFDGARSLIVTSDGGYALAGASNCSLGGNYVDIFDFGYDYHSFLGGDAWLVKTDAFGDIEWNQTYSGECGADWANSLVETPDGGYALAGCIAVDYP
jgi:hypothetical protein